MHYLFQVIGIACSFHIVVYQCINSLQYIVAQRFVQIQQHPLDYMVLLLFSWDPQGAYKEQGFLCIIIELVLCTIASVNYTLVLTIWEITQKEP